MVASKTSFVIAAVALGAASSVYAVPVQYNAGADLAARGFEDEDFQLAARFFGDELEARDMDEEYLFARDEDGTADPSGPTSDSPAPAQPAHHHHGHHGGHHDPHGENRHGHGRRSLYARDDDGTADPSAPPSDSPAPPPPPAPHHHGHHGDWHHGHRHGEKHHGHGRRSLYARDDDGTADPGAPPSDAPAPPPPPAPHHHGRHGGGHHGHHGEKHHGHGRRSLFNEDDLYARGYFDDDEYLFARAATVPEDESGIPPVKSLKQVEGFTPKPSTFGTKLATSDQTLTGLATDDNTSSHTAHSTTPASSGDVPPKGHHKHHHHKGHHHKSHRHHQKHTQSALATECGVPNKHHAHTHKLHKHTQPNLDSTKQNSPDLEKLNAQPGPLDGADPLSAKSQLSKREFEDDESVLLARSLGLDDDYFVERSFDDGMYEYY